MKIQLKTDKTVQNKTNHKIDNERTKQTTHRSIVIAYTGKVKPGAIAVSLTKGMRVRSDGPQLISQMVRHYLSVDCSVLMGANIAADIGREEVGGRGGVVCCCWWWSVVGGGLVVVVGVVLLFSCFCVVCGSVCFV